MPATTTEGVRILAMHARNILRLSVVDIDAEKAGDVIEITGRNDQGKSSVLNAIMAALCGKRYEPELLLKAGAADGEVSVKLDNGLRVTRVARQGSTELLVTDDATDMPRSSPQTLLDRLLSRDRLAFDPSAFIDAEAKDQLQMVKRALGLDDELAMIDAEIQEAENVRRIARAALERDEASVSANPAVELPYGATDRIDVTRLVEGQTSLRRFLQQAKDGVSQIVQCDSQIARMENEIRECEARIAASRNAIDHMKQRKASLVANKYADHATATEAQIAEIDAKLLQANQVNDAAFRRARAAEAVTALGKSKEAYKAAADGVVAAREKRVACLQSRKLPVDGLVLGDDGLLLHGIPLSQGSGAHKLHVALCIAAALIPPGGLRVLMLREGSLLDSGSRDAVRAFARHVNCQVWMERVTDGESATGIVIEDGRVRGGA